MPPDEDILLSDYGIIIKPIQRAHSIPSMTDHDSRIDIMCNILQATRTYCVAVQCGKICSIIVTIAAIQSYPINSCHPATEWYNKYDASGSRKNENTNNTDYNKDNDNHVTHRTRAYNKVDRDIKIMIATPDNNNSSNHSNSSTGTCYVVILLLLLLLFLLFIVVIIIVVVVCHHQVGCTVS